ncbi:amino acid adenylation domain-containing protein [Micromonospora carbonacea]|uniref:amino acid adenylation domain-containing protein n=1 Tax=Micromonospora carbonacea TaxID=47853 RepID=UPI003D749904
MRNVDRAPLTTVQADIWVAGRLCPELPQFNVGGYLRFTGPLDLDLMRTCMKRAVLRNDALRLRFEEENGEPYQWVEDESPVIATIDFSEDADPRAACHSWMARSFDRPFPLRRSRMYELALLVESESVTYAYLNAHHLVTDGWGGRLLLRQASEDYARLLSNGAGAGEPPSSSYLAVARARAERPRPAPGEADREHYRAALAGVAPALFPRRATGGPAGDSPIDGAVTGDSHPAGAGGPAGVRPAAGGRHSFPIDRALVDRITARGESPFTVVASVLATYLARIHRTDRVVLGVPVLNRRTHVERRTVGHFANELPLPVRVDGARPLADLAAEVQTTLRALWAHQGVSRGDLLRGVALPDGGRQLYDVTLSWMRWPRPEPIPGVAQQTMARSRLHDGHALAVLVNDFDDGPLTVDLDYAPDVFDADFPIEALGRHVVTLLRNALDEPDRPLARTPMLPPVERDRLTRGLNDTRADLPDDLTVHGLFARQAARTPDRTALVVDGTDETVSYADLDARANQVARALRDAGIGRGDRVAVLADRGPGLLTAILGTLKAGGAYVAVEPDHPPARLRHLLTDSGARVLVVTGDTPPPPVDPGVAVCHLKAMTDRPTAPLEPVADGADLAYVCYTSGSTGRPKGVLIEHRSVVNRLAWMQRRYPLTGDDVLVQKTPVSFDVSVWELFWWALAGARLVLPEPEVRRDPAVLLRTVARQGVSVVHFVPSMLGPFLDLLADDPAARADAAGLRLVFASGEELPPRHVDRFHRLLPAGPPAPRLVNLYGPTEATVDVSHFECRPDPAGRTARVPIGRPIDNIQLYVLGPGDEPQPVGAPGELCIAGIGVARGYLDRPELTAQRFGVDPVTGGRLYRTGDLARWLADGTVEYLGRLDDQVKIRGNRVEPGEVQHALAAVPGVREAVVVARTDPARGTHLVGYYRADADLDPAWLRAQLLHGLPDYLVPALFHRLDRIPLTAHGKLDPAALPDPAAGSATDPAVGPVDGGPPAGAARADAGTGPGPRDEVERTLAAIWARVLGVPSVGIHQDWFAVGGDSILALRVGAEAARHGLHVTVADLVARPTVAALAAHARAATPPDGDQDAPPEPFGLVSHLDRAALGDAQDAFPATRLQLGLLFHGSEREDATAYHDVFRYSLRLPWDEVAFRAAHARLLDRHPALRSSFDLGGCSEPLQVVHARVTGGLDVADLRDLDAAAADAEVLAHMRQRRRHRYAFDRAPLHLMRVHLLPSGAVDLVFSFHHVLLDGWSVATVVGDLLRTYLRLVGVDIDPPRAAALPSPAAYVVEERRAADSVATRDFWRARLDGAELTQIEGCRQYEPPGDEGTIIRHVPLPDDLQDRIRGFATAHGLPVKSVLLAAHCLLLRLYSGAADVTTGLVTHGRPDRPGAELVAGLFLNTVPLRVTPGARTWLELVRQVHGQERECHPHRRYPLHAIVGDRGGEPVFETAFNYVHMHVLTPLLELPEVELLGFDTWEETNFTLLVNVFVSPADRRVSLRVDADGRTLTPAQTDLLIDAYLRILARIVADPQGEPDFGFLAAAPQPAGPPLEAPGDVGRRLAAHARNTPDAVAITFDAPPADAANGAGPPSAAASDGPVASDGPAVPGGPPRRWTYARLDEMVDRIAVGLLRAGVRPGQLVGIALDRSPEMIAAIYGIARAGAACVPLDVTYPAERIAAMVEQARPARIVTHRRHRGLVGDPATVLDVADLLAGPAVTDEAVALPRVTADDLLYVLFTSGSTGVPKGVAMTHGALDNYQAWQIRAASAAVGGTTLQYAPLSFDVSFQEILTTISAGGILRIIDEDLRRDVPALLRLLDREAVARIFLPYVALQQLAEAAELLGIHPRALRVVISSGEQLRVTAEIRRFLAALPAGAVLENQYGPTETHLVTAYPMTGDPARWPNLPPIGPAIDGVEMHLLDERMRPVPTGVTGELYYGGNQVTRGYHGRPGLTAERCVPNPFGPPGSRLYRTGDLARYLPNGDLIWVARTDTQTKIRGFRVEPLEVEMAVMELAAEYPGIREAAVVARRREGVDSYLAAFLVGDPDAVDLADVRGRLRASLPEHLVPARWQWLPVMPLTPSGKRNDRALRELPLDLAEAPRVAPRDRYERVVADIAADLLHLPAVGAHDNLFELGGTSLTAMRLVVMLEKRFGVAVPVSAFVATPTVAGVAALLRSGGADLTFDPLVPIRARGDRRPLFLVHPLGGNVLCYVPLARHLGADQPLYALQAAGVDAGTEPLRTVPELAAAYLDAIRRIQPDGPYVIGGWSFGGVVAFEMARQLRDSGAGVDRLILLDPIARRPGDPVPVADDVLLDWFFWELMRLGHDGPPVRGVPAELATPEAKLDFIASRAGESGVLRPGSTRGSVRRLFAVFRANWEAIISYRPEVVDQDITLLRAADPLPAVLKPMHDLAGTLHLDPRNGWGELTTGRVDVIDVPGDHLVLMDEPYVVEVGRRITGLLAGDAPARRPVGDAR